jgi:hypothetical protein
VSNLIADVLSLIFGGKLPDGSEGLAGGASISLGSGYSVEAERAKNVMLLQAACDKARYNPAWQPAPGLTHCNGNADEVATDRGYDHLHGPDGKALMADQQIAVLASDPDWREDTAERFAQHAQRGGLGFATVIEHPHGHLCPGYPEPPEQSDAWGGLEPMVSNVGETVGVMRLSGAFLLRQKPLLRFYLYKPETTA